MLRTLVALATLLSFTALPARAQPATFEGLGAFPSSIPTSGANAVSADGSVVVGYSLEEDGYSAFRWTEAGGLQRLGQIGTAACVSADGSVVVGYYKAGDGGTNLFRWTEAEGSQPLGIKTGDASNGCGLSADGTVLVGRDADVDLAFRRVGGTMSYLGSLSAEDVFSSAYDVSADGQTVVGLSTGKKSGVEAFRWTAAGMVGLGYLPGLDDFSGGYAVSADGAVVVGFSRGDDREEAFRWTEATGMQGLGQLDPNGATVAFGVSSDGSIVVGLSSSRNAGLQAFIWTEEDGMRPLQDVLESDYGLDLTGWTLSRATAVSDDGTVIVGDGTNPSGRHEAWRAVLNCPAGMSKNGTSCTCSPEMAWNNPAGGLFDIADNWLGMKVPGPDTLARFDLAGWYDVRVLKNTKNEALEVGNGHARLRLSGYTHTLTGESGCGPALRVRGPSAFRIDEGALHVHTDAEVSGRLSVGSETELVVDADGDGLGRLRVGVLGDEGAVLHVHGGGRAHSRTHIIVGADSEASGAVVIEGIGSEVVADRACIVGERGSGSVIVRDESALTCNEFTAGSLAGSSGEVSVTGEGSIIEFGSSAYVGLGGSAGLTIEEGATATGEEMFAGPFESGTGTIRVTGAGSLLDVSGRLRAGALGTGEVSVEDGGRVAARGVRLGEVGEGTLTLGGGATLEVADTLIVGAAGRGDVRVTDGARAEVAGRTFVGQEARGAGSISVSGGGSELLLSEAFVGVEGIGVMGAEDGGRIEVAVLTLGPKGLVRGPVLALATIPASGKQASAEAGLHAGAMRLEPGASVTVETLRMETGSLLEVGLAAAQGPVLVEREAHLGGTLRLTPADGFAPDEAQTFEIVQAASIHGAFDAVGAPGGYRAEVEYGETRVTVTLRQDANTSVENGETPAALALGQNFPNPFSGATMLAFDLPEAGHARVSVHDLLGREVARLVDREHPAGRHEVVFTPAALPSGVYVCRLEAGGRTLTRTLTIVR